MEPRPEGGGEELFVPVVGDGGVEGVDMDGDLTTRLY